jgi:hypothetical protein
MEINRLEKLIVTHLVNKFPPFMKTECSAPSSQEQSTDLYPEPDESRSILQEFQQKFCKYFVSPPFVLHAQPITSPLIIITAVEAINIS